MRVEKGLSKPKSIICKLGSFGFSFQVQGFHQGKRSLRWAEDLDMKVALRVGDLDAIFLEFVPNREHGGTHTFPTPFEGSSIQNLNSKLTEFEAS